MKESRTLSHISGRSIIPLVITASDCRDYSALSRIGIHFSDHQLRTMMHAINNADVKSRTSIASPLQYLQSWLPGFVEMATTPHKIDELAGIDIIGAWEDEEIVQGVKESIDQAPFHGDTTNIALNSRNTTFEARTVVRFESGFHIAHSQAQNASCMNLNSTKEKRNHASVKLEIQRNRVGFFGFNNGENRTFGLLNAPSLLPYQTLPEGSSSNTTWKTKTFLEIAADIRVMMAQLRKQSANRISPETSAITLALPTSAVEYLSVTSDFGVSVNDWIARAYPALRIVSVPEFEAANGGSDVAYLYAESVADGAQDGGHTFTQCVPAKFLMLGVEHGTKDYSEDFSNATAGIIVKRPYAVVRVTGI